MDSDVTSPATEAEVSSTLDLLTRLHMDRSALILRKLCYERDSLREGLSRAGCMPERDLSREDLEATWAMFS